MSGRYRILAIAAESLVSALVIVAVWLGPNMGPGAHVLLTAIVLAVLFVAIAFTMGEF